MPPEESEESEREEEVGSDLDEESADEAEQDDDQPNSKPSRDIALKPAKRKAVKVDENFPVIKRAKVTKGSR